MTGAGGFVGRHLAERLLGAGHATRVLVRRGNVPAWLGERAEVVVGDVRDPAMRARAVAGIDVVFHLASLVTSVRASEDEYRRVNALASEALALDAARAGVRRFVLASSIAVHPANTGEILDETSPIAPEDAYGRSKAEAEQRVGEVAAATHTALVVLRPSRVYGPRDPSLGMLFRTIARGRFLLVGPGTARIDFLHVDDLVGAFVAASERGSGAYVVGGPEAVTIRRFTEVVARAYGRRMPRLRIPAGPGLVAARVIEVLWTAAGREPPIAPKRLRFLLNERLVRNDRAEHDLAWRPAVRVEEGVPTLAAWYREHTSAPAALDSRSRAGPDQPDSG